jgi:ABC-type dipeptide/oligopeptide/nickel transport system permease component
MTLFDPADSDRPIAGAAPPDADGKSGFRPLLRAAISAGARIAILLVTMLIVSIVVFVVLRLLPADPVALMLGPNATPVEADALRHALGLDRSIPAQFALWLTDALRADLGRSLQSSLPITQLILESLPATLELAFFGLVLGIGLGITLGLAAFHWRGGPIERLVDGLSNLVIAIPNFLWAILFILAFGIGLKLLPFIGPIDPQFTLPRVTGFLLIDSLIHGNLAAFDSRLAHLALPAVALSMGTTPLILRVLRSNLIGVYAEEYIVAARMRGVGEPRILLWHALRNAALPTISLIGVQAGHLFGGTLLIEAIYGLPGLGNLMINAIRTHDLPVMQGVAVTYCAIVLVLNSGVDLTYAWLNPRLRPQ